MKKWQETAADIKFEGKDKVLSMIKEDQKKQVGILEKAKLFLNYEFELALAPVLACAVGLVLILVLQMRPVTDLMPTYTITVVNQWGQYENY